MTQSSNFPAKVAVLNESGSVGKTVTVSHLLAPRIPGATIMAIESTNESAVDLGLQAEQLRGEQFSRLHRELILADRMIVDVGASNIENFLAGMIRHDKSYREIDMFIVPVIPTNKAMRESISTIKQLAEIGVEATRIRVLFNRVSRDVREEFAPIFGFEKQSGGIFRANPAAAIEDNDVFDLLSARNTTIAAVLADDTDYRALVRQEAGLDDATIARYLDLHILQSQARPVAVQMDAAFSALFAGM